MTTSINPEKNTMPKKLSRPKLIIAIIVIVVAIGIYSSLGSKEDPNAGQGTTFEAFRGDLRITVVEGGSVEAKESQQLKSEVHGQTKILSIVEEGSMVTPEDVAAGKVLVELDSKELLDRLTEEELQYQNALASFTEAREQYGIQINQNQSDVKAAELDSKFALMDLKKFLGEDVAVEVSRIVEENFAAAQPEVAAGSEREVIPPAEPSESDGQENTKVEMESEASSDLNIDFTKYLRLDAGGDGEALQRLRKLENDSDLAREEVGVAESRLEGTKRLFQKDFVTKIEMENDELAVKRKNMSQRSAETDMELYIKYEFPKQAEKLLSDYEESLRALQRARRLAVSKLAQAEAKLNSAEARYELQTRQRDELKEQIEKCIIPATKPGLVVYGEGNRNYYRDNNRIEEGASVRERQVIITIPDTTQMTVDVKVHESYVKRVVKGQRAEIRVDAFPDKLLKGEVIKIGVLPDSQNRWMNPDLKVYTTTIEIEGQHDWLKPGMSAEGEIIIETRKDVVMIPLQAVAQEKGETVVYLPKSGMERRIVETGSFDATFIEIKSGLDVGEVVALRAPASSDRGEGADQENSSTEEKAKKEMMSEKKTAEDAA